MISDKNVSFDDWLKNILNPKEVKEVKEDWISLKNYPYYEISSTIPYVLRDKSTKRIIPQSINNIGYYQISLNNQTLLLHRIIAEQFLENPNNYSDVNHKNHNKLDNWIQNLEWLSHSTNLEQRKKYSKQKSEVVKNINLDNCVEIKSFGYNKLERYYFDKVNEIVYLKKKTKNSYKVIKPTYRFIKVRCSSIKTINKIPQSGNR